MMMIGGTVEVVASIGGVRLPRGPLRSSACAYFEVGTCDRATKTGERVVRPEYGDVFVAPVSAENKHFCVYTGREVGSAYVIKVGEAAHDKLDALLALTLQHPCVVRIALK
jgi:hypothetical protein